MGKQLRDGSVRQRVTEDISLKVKIRYYLSNRLVILLLRLLGIESCESSQFAEGWSKFLLKCNCELTCCHIQILESPLERWVAYKFNKYKYIHFINLISEVELIL